VSDIDWYTRIWASADPFLRLAAMELVRKPHQTVDEVVRRFELSDHQRTKLAGVQHAYESHPDYEGWLSSLGHVLKTALEPRSDTKSGPSEDF